MWSSILSIIDGILKVIPLIIKLFKKSTTEEVQKDKKKFEEELDDVRKGKRPKW